MIIIHCNCYPFKISSVEFQKEICEDFYDFKQSESNTGAKRYFKYIKLFVTYPAWAIFRDGWFFRTQSQRPFRSLQTAASQPEEVNFICRIITIWQSRKTTTWPPIFVIFIGARIPFPFHKRPATGRSTLFALFGSLISVRFNVQIITNDFLQLRQLRGLLEELSPFGLFQLIPLG